MKNLAVLFFTILTLNCYGAGATISSLNGLGTNLTLKGFTKAGQATIDSFGQISAGIWNSQNNGYNYLRMTNPGTIFMQSGSGTSGNAESVAYMKSGFDAPAGDLPAFPNLFFPINSFNTNTGNADGGQFTGDPPVPLSFNGWTMDDYESEVTFAASGYGDLGCYYVAYRLPSFWFAANNGDLDSSNNDYVLFKIDSDITTNRSGLLHQRWGRSFKFLAEDNENGGAGGDIVLAGGQGDSGQPLGQVISTNATLVGGQIISGFNGFGLTNVPYTKTFTSTNLTIVSTVNPDGTTNIQINVKQSGTVTTLTNLGNFTVAGGGVFIGNGSGITNATTSYTTNDLVTGSTNVNNTTHTIIRTIPVKVSAPAATLGSAEIDAQLFVGNVWVTVGDCDIAGGATSIIATNKEVLTVIVPSGASLRLTNTTSGTGYIAGLDAGATNTYTILP